VTDGSRLYVTEIKDNRFVLAQVASMGGEAAIISTPFTDPLIADVAPNHSELLVIEASGGWKDADPDIPILKQAKAEYAKLQ
jgi:hypothetical protein